MTECDLLDICGCGYQATKMLILHVAVMGVVVVGHSYVG